MNHLAHGPEKKRPKGHPHLALLEMLGLFMSWRQAQPSGSFGLLFFVGLVVVGCKFSQLLAGDRGFGIARTCSKFSSLFLASFGWFSSFLVGVSLLPAHAVWVVKNSLRAAGNAPGLRDAALQKLAYELRTRGAQAGSGVAGGVGSAVFPARGAASRDRKPGHTR